MSPPEMDHHHQQEGSDTETNINSSDVQAFINLVDREAYLLALLNENNQIQEKNQMRTGIGWQPTFEIQDFYIPPSGKQNVSPKSESLPLLQPLTKGRDGGEIREEALKTGIKRRRDCLGSSSNGSPEKTKQKIPRHVFPRDLHKNKESSDSWNLWHEK